MNKPFMRIPYTGPLPPPIIIPSHANTSAGAISALYNFLVARSYGRPSRTVLLSGAGISVASGLADYRGKDGTYTRNKAYRPIYYHEFLESHEARKRYWARSFLGWPTLHHAKPNNAHWAVKKLGELGLLSSVITQNVDSFHPIAHPELSTIELHGFLRSVVCVNCHAHMPRDDFQKSLAVLNPAWAEFLEELLKTGALDTEDPVDRRKKGLQTNPDGDVDLPRAPYSTFRYPACPTCLTRPPKLENGRVATVEVDSDGAWSTASTAGVLKPAVIMFGESISSEVKIAAEEAIDHSDRILIVGSSLATYSAWRLVKKAKDNGMPIGILNLGGVRGEDKFFEHINPDNKGEGAFRCNENAQDILPEVVDKLQSHTHTKASIPQIKAQAS
ncbi:MAG: hypothetical protein M1834_000535 [Cirrosporium novae-zelandiae]|nr:MAG: hypothetical protein M1834_000535 [Cirrosporium novae-zelandiae]